VIDRHGPPPLWGREPGFATLVYIILEQQVSLASARATYERLQRACRGRVTPRAMLRLTDGEMLAIGFSRQKAGYARGLAEAILTRRLDLEHIATLPDDEAHAALIAQKGIGPWTAGIYLLMALGRPDIWPHGDLALAISAQAVLGLPERPTYDALRTLADAWRPHRATAARILWHAYLSQSAGQLVG
jgi:DNA-3-methyladenine glycosylase II